MVLKLYYDLMSQPSRALYILLKTTNSKFESKLLDLRKGVLENCGTIKLQQILGFSSLMSKPEWIEPRNTEMREHYSEEFTAINRMQRVPVIDHDGFILTESIAIIRYLSRANIIPDSLYPKDSKLQARVDEYLEWQHVGLRLHCAMYFRATYMDPILFGKKPNEITIQGYENRMTNALDLFENKWLSNGTEFIAGNTITVADLLAACELEQPRIAGYDPAEHYNGISSWWKKVKNYFNPYYDEAHVIVNKIIAKQAKSKAKL